MTKALTILAAAVIAMALMFATTGCLKPWATDATAASATHHPYHHGHGHHTPGHPHQEA